MKNLYYIVLLLFGIMYIYIIVYWLKLEYVKFLYNTKFPFYYITFYYIVRYIYYKIKNNKINKGKIFLKKIKRYEKKNNTNIIFLVDRFWKRSKFIKEDISHYIININDEDTFMDRINNLKYKDIDVILHTTGGDVKSSDMMTLFFLQYDDGIVRTHVPEYAFSAGTIISMGGKIHMDKYAFLGPTDPQIMYMETEECNYYAPSRVLIDIIEECEYKSKFELHSDLYIKAHKAKSVHEDNIELFSKCLKQTQPTCIYKNAMKLFTYGKYPHHKALTMKMLTKKENDICMKIEKIPKRISILFKQFKLYKLDML